MAKKKRNDFGFGMNFPDLSMDFSKIDADMYGIFPKKSKPTTITKIIRPKKVIIKVMNPRVTKKTREFEAVAMDVQGAVKTIKLGAKATKIGIQKTREAVKIARPQVKKAAVQARKGLSFIRRKIVERRKQKQKVFAEEKTSRKKVLVNLLKEKIRKQKVFAEEREGKFLFEK